ncbi:DUF2306 domain-containing protein [Silanimonas sp.]|jgi:hypothetical protein|uniref:DUF2306 domain-containing protein n=1 Tax=Silanimonas sp. TaxID=1929290 RepID=UPI0037CB13E7
MTKDPAPCPDTLNRARRRLSKAAAAWFVTAAAGQWAFIAFIVLFFTPPLLQGDPLAMNSKPHVSGWVPGDAIGNGQFVAHVFLGALVTLSGLLQLVPAIRRRWPALHRWNGRLFMVTALVASLTGFYLTWVRGSQLNLPSALSTSLNGVLILAFVALAWRSALQSDIATHRRQALRAWVLVNGVWFLRIGIMLAGLGLMPFGVDMQYDGVVFLGVSFASWLLPLALLQLYFAAERAATPRAPNVAAAALYALAGLTAAGSAAAVAFMWWPYL